VRQLVYKKRPAHTPSHTYNLALARLLQLMMINMKLVPLVLLFFFLSPLKSFAQGEEVKSFKVTFKIKNAGITVDGSFKDFKGDIRFDPNDLSKSQLRASVSVASIDTDSKMRDRDLQDKKYFYSEKFPRISLESTRIKSLGKDQYNGIFNLTIRDVTKEIEIPFVVKRNGKISTFIGNFMIDRRDYGVGGNSFILSDDTRVFIEVTTIKK
jgi:polyisoprenoid-binding protein YceI